MQKWKKTKQNKYFFVWNIQVLRNKFKWTFNDRLFFALFVYLQSLEQEKHMLRRKLSEAESERDLRIQELEGDYNDLKSKLMSQVSVRCKNTHTQWFPHFSISKIVFDKMQLISRPTIICNHIEIFQVKMKRRRHKEFWMRVISLSTINQWGNRQFHSEKYENKFQNRYNTFPH